VTLLPLFVLVCGVLAVESRQPLWLRHVSTDVGVFWIQASKYLSGQLEGTEYPPMAVLYFLLPGLADRILGVPFPDGFAFLNYVWIGLHLAFLNQTAGRLSALLFAALMLAAGPIVMFRFELFVSFLVLMAWAAWRRGLPAVAGAVAGVAVLTKLYPLLLFPVLCRPPDESSPKRQIASFAAGVAAALMLVMAVFVAGGGSLSMIEGTLSFHGSKPVALESTPAAVAMAFDYLRGAWPSRPVNAWGIHGLSLGRVPHLVSPALLALAATSARRGPGHPLRAGDPDEPGLLDLAVSAAVPALAGGLRGAAPRGRGAHLALPADRRAARGGATRRAGRLPLPLQRVPGHLL
jgi:hypothetical protein